MVILGRPSKSAGIIKLEGKSHRTKSELEQRETAESSLLSGVKLREKDYVKNNPIAHKEFLRLKKLLEGIQKNDALQENIINRYCQIYAECLDFEEKREMFYRNLTYMDDERDDRISNAELSWLDFMKLKSTYQAQIINLDKQVQAKREMLLKIEKETLMTVAAALRAVPKKPVKEFDTNGEMFD